MSDTKKKANGDGASPTTSKGSKFAAQFSKFINLCTEMKNDPAAALDYEKTIDENVTLKSTLKKRDDEVNNLKADIEQLKLVGDRNLNNFGEKYVEFKARLQEGDSSKRSLGETPAERKKTKFYCEDSLTTVDLPHVGDKFEAFSEKCHQMVMGCFDCQAPPKNVSFLLEHLDKCLGRDAIRPPLTASTTISARLMRCAAAELVIANAMVNHIFTDIYIPGDVERQKAVSATLELLVMKNPRRESLVRCQLLAEYEIDTEILSSVHQAAFDEICKVLDDLLPAGNPRDKFHTKLDALLGEALELWRPLQKSKNRVSAHLDFNAKVLKRDEDAYADYDGPNSQGAGAPRSPGFAGSEPVLLLFPLIYTSEEVVYQATALWSDQGAFIDAKNEASEHRLSVTGSIVGAVDSTRPSAGRRRMSLGGRMPTSSTSSLPPAGTMNSSSDVSSSRLVSSRRTENGIPSTGRDR
ncbi:hypothetical protein CONLIGDRAFT_101504 [Coniochaeta ligniaria NRRL 30616]|uniref:Uncharacterized protein n=1 Tax=Coniochaeta ligniaria NRRL 30616 TaxID=1408157 RepID=A0A1J7IU51_9PEZI|nr:hypothetical protein CONLIGDRAFT_101504 [Coniochaeta ligniaria NRRL 30616]